MEFRALTISIHAPTRGATCENPHFVEIIDNFNPRSYKRSDIEISELHNCIRISIHAPTRGATSAKQDFLYLIAISIHAPTRGATSQRQ